MTRVLIRVDGDLSDELTTAFPHLEPRHHRQSTTLTGDLADGQELEGVLSLLHSMGLEVVQIVTIPGD